MSKRSWTLALFIALLLGALTACQKPSPTATIVSLPTATPRPPTATVAPTMPATPTQSALPTPTADVQAPATSVPQPTPTSRWPRPQTALTPTPAWQIPEVSDDDQKRGAADAGMILVEYGDYQCPYCSRVADMLKRLADAYPDQVLFVYRHFPLISIHDKAMITAEAAEAAGAQGKFWEMHELLYARQQEWSTQSAAQVQKTLEGYAQELGLDVTKFSQALTNGTYKSTVQKQYEEASNIGIPGTPTLFINGQYLNPQQIPLNDMVLTGLARLYNYYGPEYEAAPPLTIDPAKPYFATVKTNKGAFCIELLPQSAPNTVNSFVFLAGEGYFDGAPFHRVLPDFVAQTGDPTGSGFGGPGYRLTDEIDPNLKHDGPGMVSMANSGANTNGSQFFITYQAAPDLDGGYTIFGRVKQGMEVVNSLLPRDPQQDPYAPYDWIETITIAAQCGE